MKNIILFEGFQSDIIKKFSKFFRNLDSSFINELIRICKENDIAIGSIPDENIIYSKYKKEPFSNSIKLLFNIDNKYIGYLKNSEVDIHKAMINKNEIFKKINIDFSKHKNTTYDLKDGDIILASFDDINLIAVVFKYNDIFYGVQNLVQGGSPSSEYFNEYSKFGVYTWQLANHSDDWLYYKVLGNINNDTTIKYLEVNFNNKISKEDDIVYTLEIKIPNDNLKISSIRKNREDIKLDNKDLKKKNLDKYISTMFHRMNINDLNIDDDGIFDDVNFNKIKIFIRKYPVYIFLIYGDEIFINLDYLYLSLMHKDNLNSFLNFKKLYERYIQYNVEIKDEIKKIKEKNIKVYNEINKINEKVEKKLSNINLTSLISFELFLKKINNIKYILNKGDILEDTAFSKKARKWLDKNINNIF